jgi:adenine-specific DNA-methyltransferase
MKEKLEKLKELCDLFQSNIKEYKSAKYDEANTRTDFIDKFFEVLDWDVRNNQGYAEGYREVVREDKVIIEGKPKAPDYSFRIGGNRKFFLEAKKPSINIKEEIEPAFQIRRYGYTAKLPLSILTDFEEFAIYDTRIKPEKTDKASVARVFYCTYEEYEKHFEFIYNTFSKDAINKGSFDKYVVENKNKKGSSEVDKEFLSLIEDWRESLAKNIAIRNKDLDIYSLNNSVQVIIDRIIFLRIAEDRNMEKYGTLLNIAVETHGRASLRDQLNKIFLKANDKYNSGLFKPEKWISELDIDDKTFQNIIKYLYYPDCPYELSVLPIEILGNIYEQFLGKTIRLTPSRQVKIEEKVGTGHDPSVRKAGGVYYTPQYIVNYIVQNTVGEKIKGVDLYDHPKLTILDPACGSGSFLVGTYSFLLDKYLESYTDKKRLDKCLKNGLIYQVSQNTYRLSITVKQDILLRHIYGVDIDNQAVEVTKLSLLLKLMEDENSESADRLFKHSDVKLLPDLQNNIKCGNSLIGSDFYSDKNLSLFGKEEMRKVNTFDWDKEFADVFKDGGFDCVIGNPPYVRSDTIDSVSKEYISKRYSSAIKQYDIYILFIEKSIKLLNTKGLLGIIVSNKFLISDYGKEIRKFILSNTEIKKAIDVSYDNVFKTASVYPYIIILKREFDEKKRNSNLIEFCKDFAINKELKFENKKQETFNKDFLLDFSTIGSDWVEKITKDTVLLGDISNITRGFRPPPDNLLVKSKDAKKYLIGKDLKRAYYYSWSGNLVKYDTKNIFESKPIEIFRKEKILFRDIGLKFNGVYDNEGLLCLKTIYFLYLKEDYTYYSLKFILGLLNSKLLYKFFNLKYSIAHISGGYLRFRKQFVENLPIPKLDLSNKTQKAQNDKIVSLVETMLESQKQLQSASTDSDKKLLQQKCDLLDKQIDKLVYELYGLTEEEIKIVEGASL